MWIGYDLIKVSVLIEPRHSSTLSQIELLKKAKAMGLEVLTYKIQGGYETLVMLTPKKLAVMQEIEADLIDAGFQYKLGQGYVI